uniref:Uncharacterized protein n=1 Tax=Anguilla anguilla TaxID=7936 RepID=A0A0E9WBF5_ANGAN
MNSQLIFTSHTLTLYSAYFSNISYIRG